MRRRNHDMAKEFDIFSELGMAPEADDFNFGDDDTEDLPEEGGDSGIDDEGFEDESDGDDEDDGDSSEDEPKALADAGVMSLLQEMRAELVSLREQVKSQDKTEPPEPTSIDFVDEAGFEEAVSSQVGLNKLLNTVHQAGHASAMQMLPQLVREQAEAVYEQKMRVESFFRSNPDLDGVRPLVGVIAKEVAEEMPDETSYKKLFLEVAKRTRKRMGGAAGGGKRSTSTKHSNPGSVPSGAGRPGSGRPAGKRKENVAAEIKKMMQL